MLRKIYYSRISKIIIVLFLTLLIWVSADLAKTELFSASNAILKTAKSTNPNLWVHFEDELSVQIENIVFKGSASKVAEIRRKLDEGSLKLEFFLNPEQEGLTTPGQHLLDVLSFLRKNHQIKELGLTVEYCIPETVQVNVLKFAKRHVDIQCVEEDGSIVKASVEPAQVEMFVPEKWEGEKLVAYVTLTRREINQARLTPIKKTPYVKLTVGTREASEPVKITMPSEEERLLDYTITTATPGFLFSTNMQGKFGVDVENLPEVIMVTIRATPEAKRAYEKSRYQVILEIDDNDKDVKEKEILRRALIYNFPEEYVRNGEIELKSSPVTARFKLIPLSAEPQPTTGE